MKLSEVNPTNRFFGLFVGRSGAGKTCAAVSFPTPGLLIDIDLRASGALAAQEWLPPGKLDEWEVIQYRPGSGFTEIETKLEEIDKNIRKGTNKYKTVVLDSLTTESQLLISDALQKDNSDGSPMVHGKIIGTMRVPGPGHFGYEQVGMTQVIEYLKAWPINVIVSAHIIPLWGKPPGGNEYSENIVIGEQLALRPNVGVRQEIHFNEVYKFCKEWSAGEVVRKVRFVDADLAKTAYGSKLPKRDVNITNVDFYKMWCGYLNGEIKK